MTVFYQCRRIPEPAITTAPVRAAADPVRERETILTACLPTAFREKIPHVVPL